MMKRACLLLLIFSRPLFSTHCLGPDEVAANPPVLRTVCESNLGIQFAVFYWSAQQEGREFAILNQVSTPVINPTPTDIEQLNQLVDAEYISPTSKWQFGYRVGLNYTTHCDNWDIGLTWTSYHNRSKKVLETSFDSSSIITLWSAFAPVQGDPVYARAGIETWKVKLNMLDLPLGRKYWVSRWMNLCPHLGLRYARVSQDLDLQYAGGSWSPRIAPTQFPLHNAIHLDNSYKGGGLRAGLDGEYHFGCGVSMYTNFAASLLYGRFKLAHREENQLTISPYTLGPILSTSERLKGSRAILDFALGIQWSKQFFECKVGIITKLGWEQHLFFNQNQFWRVQRVGIAQPTVPDALISTPTGQNVIDQERGSLTIQGWTLSMTLEY